MLAPDIVWLAIGMASSLLLATVYLLFVKPAPYGRYSPKGHELWSINARVAWFLQEIPSALVPLYWMQRKSAARAWEPANAFLLSLFVGHYLYRSIVYAWRIRSSNKSPVSIVLSAFLFTSANGYLQARTLCDVQGRSALFRHR